MDITYWAQNWNRNKFLLKGIISRSHLVFKTLHYNGEKLSLKYIYKKKLINAKRVRRSAEQPNLKHTSWLVASAQGNCSTPSRCTTYCVRSVPTKDD